MLDRRNFIKQASTASVAMSLGLASLGAGLKTRPNIIIILADDLGYGDLGCYGSAAIRTPNIDRMAEQGVKLTSFYASAPICSPSRASLMTGRYPARTGVVSVFWPSRNPLSPMFHLPFGMGPGMSLKEITLAELMKDAGYRTCCIGKWHLGDLKPYRPNHRGFDHFMGVHYSNDEKPLILWRNDEEIEKAPVNQDFLTQKYTREALDWIDENHDSPFFLYLPHTAPHLPLHCSPDFRGQSEAGLYGDCVEEMDWSVGEVLKALDKHGIADNTFVFFTSDNGPAMEGNAGCLRGRKGQTWEGGMRVPAIARWPGVIPEGKVTGEMAMLFDLFSTSLSIAGAAAPADRPIDGKDVLFILQGKPSPHEDLFYYRFRDLEAVRRGKWKLFPNRKWDTSFGFIDRGPKLFNLEKDPGESFNLAGTHPEIVRELTGVLENWEATFVRGMPRM